MASKWTIKSKNPISLTPKLLLSRAHSNLFYGNYFLETILDYFLQIIFLQKFIICVTVPFCFCRNNNYQRNTEGNELMSIQSLCFMY